MVAVAAEGLIAWTVEELPYANTVAEAYGKHGRQSSYCKNIKKQNNSEDDIHSLRHRYDL